VLAILPVAFPTFAILMAGSGLVRLVLATRIDVSATWSTATAAFNIAELRRGRRRSRPALLRQWLLRRPPDDRGGDPA
jgi:hypothetical protein